MENFKARTVRFPLGESAVIGGALTKNSKKNSTVRWFAATGKIFNTYIGSVVSRLPHVGLRSMLLKNDFGGFSEIS
jgi:hypothetical protein